MRRGDDALRLLRLAFIATAALTLVTACADLRGFGLFVLLTDEGTQAYMRDVAKVPAEPDYWARCTSPGLVQLSVLPGYTTFRVEG